MKPHVPISVALLLLSTFAGCDKRQEECDKVIEIEAAAVEELKKVKAQMDGEANDGAALARDTRKIVDIAKNASKDIAAVKLTTEGLEPHVKAYTDMLDVVVTANEEVVDALEKAGDYNESTVQAAQQAFRQAHHGIAVACGRRAPECEKLNAASSKINETMSELGQATAGDLGKMFSDHLAELKAINYEDDVVEKAAEAYIESIEEFVRLLGIEARIRASLEKIAEATEQEAKIVENLTKFCKGK